MQRWYDEAWDTHQENMQLIQRLESIANQDALTGTANRRALNATWRRSGSEKRAAGADDDRCRLF
ncbi:membrane-associated sensor domain-containing protein [Klebsiella pneumoniae]|nr:membrane-associated sensor domain-containing protein [Klebsiella pneumoniae]